MIRCNSAGSLDHFLAMVGFSCCDHHTLTPILRRRSASENRARQLWRIGIAFARESNPRVSRAPFGDLHDESAVTVVARNQEANVGWRRARIRFLVDVD